MNMIICLSVPVREGEDEEVAEKLDWHHFCSLARSVCNRMAEVNRPNPQTEEETSRGSVEDEHCPFSARPSLFVLAQASVEDKLFVSTTSMTTAGRRWQLWEASRSFRRRRLTVI